MEDEEQRNQLDDDLVGYRFHPTEEEIVSYFLEEKLRGRDYRVRAINEVDINKFEPWVLPRFSAIESEDPTPFVLCRLKKKSKGGDEPSPPQLASNSGNCLNVNIVPQSQSLFKDDELSALQLLIDRAQGPSCSNDSSRSQLYIREQEDDLLDSMWASGEEQHLHENVQTRLHDFKPMKSVSGYIADSSNLPVAQSGSSDGSIVLQAFGHHFKPDKPKELPEKPKEMPVIRCVANSGNFRPVQQSGSRRYGPIVLQQSDSSDSAIETTHEQRGKVMRTPRIVAQEQGGGPIYATLQCSTSSKQQLQCGYDESYKKPWEKPKEPKMAPSRKGSYIYLETPAWSHKQYPPSVYIKNIVVASILLAFFVGEMVSLH
ncbi:hypothetical protein LWI29_003964 [Acer saccharum]|uniref:NAC domain-containing protein n=1 Tax=Acer saccharum TaxID=4024 RepID=A0AA39RUY7_ACESA|nr:hypothetical protein LWI29_003964 [Acer saccharum]